MTTTPSAVSVRLEIYQGDELTDVLTVQCDAATASALQEFRDTGSCKPQVLDGLRALLPHALPAAHLSLAELDRHLREDLCSAYLQSRAAQVETDMCFRLQKS